MNEYAPGSRWELGPDGMLRRRVLTDQNGVPLEQEPIPAADPWVKIEPGCEMPEEKQNCLICLYCEPIVGKYSQGGWDFDDGSGCAFEEATHYAVLRMPEKEPAEVRDVD